MSLRWSEPGVEPALDELLSDPIVHMVMHRDRIAPSDVMEAVRAARARLVQNSRRRTEAVAT